MKCDCSIQASHPSDLTTHISTTTTKRTTKYYFLLLLSVGKNDHQDENIITKFDSLILPICAFLVFVLF